MQVHRQSWRRLWQLQASRATEPTQVAPARARTPQMHQLTLQGNGRGSFTWNTGDTSSSIEVSPKRTTARTRHADRRAADPKSSCPFQARKIPADGQQNRYLSPTWLQSRSNAKTSFRVDVKLTSRDHYRLQSYDYESTKKLSLRNQLQDEY